ncbi:hypothetical protein ROA7023_04468 [Roseisalinus antarcticus]|uniref:Uncharacterized protein n=1 Tax=Roseisalinus antarcticus TaxID=254357 RepID=A0A1Y5U022_9RHOB|nr:hypothetical protein ROA7023_04468 [Roseisalinus antarcticus]
MPAEGLLILRDGEPGEPEVTLSPLRYRYQHRAEIEAVVQGADRDVAFDTLTGSIGTALAADRTLGGLCDWVEAEAPRSVDLPVEGAASLKADVILFDGRSAWWVTQLALRPNGCREWSRSFQLFSRAMTSSAGRSGARRSRMLNR